MKKFADMTAEEQAVTIAGRAARAALRAMDELRRMDNMDPEIELAARDLRNAARHLESCISQCGTSGAEHRQRWAAIAAEADRQAAGYTVG